MDLKSGKTYASAEAAAADGVPESDLIYLGKALLAAADGDGAAMGSGPKPPAGAPGEIVQPKNGPFKGRTYRRNALGQLELVSAGKQLHRRRNA